jgi:putative MFS transporter
MTAQGEDLVTLYDKAPLNARYWVSVALSVTTSIFDFFDFFLVGFLVAVLAPQWHLNFGQTSVMLLSAGVGAIVGSLAWGALADRWGRKSLMVVGVVLCALGAGSISIIPDGAWLLFAALRFVVGFGVGAVAAVAVPLIVEYTPTRHRTVLTSVTLIPVSLGILAASLTAATMLPYFGWRGLAALGYVPLVPAVLIALIMPESVRWLVSRGRDEEARRIVGQALNMPPAGLPQRASATGKTGDFSRSSFADLWARPGLFWLTVIVWFGASTANYGVFLWGPTIVALLMGVAPAEAAHLFVFVSLTGMLGRTAFAFLPQRLGRRRCGEIMGYGIAVFLGAAALFFDRTILGYPAFVVLLIPAALFFDGGLFGRDISRAIERARRWIGSGRQWRGQDRRPALSCVDRGCVESDYPQGDDGSRHAGLLVPRCLRSGDRPRFHPARRRNSRQTTRVGERRSRGLAARGVNGTRTDELRRKRETS